MANVEDSLSVIPPSQWKSLLPKFQGLRGITARIAITSQLLNIEKFPKFPVTAYAPFNDPENGLIFLWKLMSKGYELAVYCMNTDTSSLQKALSTTKIIDWTCHIKICHVPKTLHDILDEITIRLGLKRVYNETYTAYIALNDARKFEIASYPDIRFARIGSEYAKELDDAWPHRYRGSLEYFQFMLKHEFCLAILGEPNGELRGWIFTSVRGDLHSVNVKSEFRQRGYGQLLVKTMSKKLADENREVLGYVITHNMPAQEMFLKMGFEFIDILKWIDASVG